MKFEDPIEREKVIGPLYESEAKTAVPVFGDERLTSNATRSAVQAAVKSALQSTADPIINLLSEVDLRPSSNNLQAETLSGQLKKMKMAAVGGDDVTPAAAKLFSSQELHDRSHYSSFSFTYSQKSQTDLPDNVILRRAKAGYLFDCKLNKSIVMTDYWLRDVWEWIQGNYALSDWKTPCSNALSGAEEAATDDGMVSGPLDLSYMGVYTIWNNLLGMDISVQSMQG
jgi:hypothetical protein